MLSLATEIIYNLCALGNGVRDFALLVYSFFEGPLLCTSLSSVHLIQTACHPHPFMISIAKIPNKVLHKFQPSNFWTSL